MKISREEFSKLFSEESRDDIIRDLNVMRPDIDAVAEIETMITAEYNNYLMHPEGYADMISK